MNLLNSSFYNLYFNEIMHGAVALPVAVFLFSKFKKIKYIYIYFIVVYFIDVDHLLDYFLFYKKLSFNLIDFLSVKYFEIKQTGYLLFHAWEYVLIMLMFYFFTKNKFLLIFSLAIGSHLLWDSLSNGLGFDFYFIFVRALNDFALK